MVNGPSAECAFERLCWALNRHDHTRHDLGKPQSLELSRFVMAHASLASAASSLETAEI